ncbi:TetR/AcrR family transcriptional regulator [Paenibacillus sp. 19GGS1-52]|uniref:TetR/AcrR family transcriptional regulator n=1 Tax=Paenibacillus sp. 19GGS1-52 TaxID=2758563 RepID=UPI001EFBF3AC|nr:TetR/AcrR family transcriptional regulator [Paenibacillus sp. 19GGS1-52]ULO07635.1 TetR/AcrR family transcriptional regulator [Paenibacillus sp. 19GGS1-52]
MEFDRVRNDTQRKIRVEQIKNAAIKLFDTEQFHEIDLAKIAKETTFTRGNLYKYISSKEEIFLLVVLDEFKDWISDLKKNFTIEMTHEIQAFSQRWAEVVYRHQRFLKLISMLFTIIERNVTLEKLVSFKSQFSIETVDLNHVIKYVFPVWDDKTIDKFFRVQTHYLIGLFPYTSPTPIQKEAMEQLDINYKSLDFINEFSEFISFTVSYLNHNLKVNK